MKFNQIFKRANTQITEDDLLFYNDIKDSELKSDLESLANYFQRDVENFFYTDKLLGNSYGYYHNYFIDFFDSADTKFLNATRSKERFYSRENHFGKMLDKNELADLILLQYSYVQFWFFKGLFERIPDKQKFDIFREIYVSNEYGFQNFDLQFLNKVLSFAPKPPAMLKKKADKDGYLTIYRGIGTESTSIYNAYSWTLDFNVALMFAAKHSDSGKVYKAKVHTENIKAYFDDRRESEIIVLPQNTESIVEMDLLMSVTRIKR